MAEFCNSISRQLIQIWPLIQIFYFRFRFYCFETSQSNPASPEPLGPRTQVPAVKRAKRLWGRECRVTAKRKKNKNSVQSPLSPMSKMAGQLIHHLNARPRLVIVFILYILRFSDRISHVKTPFGNFRSQSEWRNDFLTREKSVSSNHKAPVKTYQYFQRRLYCR